MNTDDQPPLIEFPCDFSIKSMGLADADFAALVLAIVSRHAADVDHGAISSRASSGGKYVSVTVTIQARDQAQLDAIYRELSSHERILMVL